MVHYIKDLKSGIEQGFTSVHAYHMYMHVEYMYMHVEYMYMYTCKPTKAYMYVLTTTEANY